MKVSRCLVQLMLITSLFSSISYCQESYNIPYIKNLIVDGKQFDWEVNGFRVETMCYPDINSENFPEANSLYAAFRIAWNEDGFFVLLRVMDDKLEEADNINDLDLYDSFEVFVSGIKSESKLIHLGVSPGVDDKQPNIRLLNINKENSSNKKKTDSFEARRNIIPGGGYLAEMIIPWSLLGISPSQSTKLKFQLFVNDKDGDLFEKKSWFPFITTYNNLNAMNLLQLGDLPSPAVLTSASYIIENFRRIRIEATATSEFTNKTIRVNQPDGASIYSDFKLNGQMVNSYLTLPINIYNELGSIALLCDDKPFYEISLKNIEMKKESFFKSQQIRFKSFVFTGEKFPVCNFEEPSLVEDLIGPYQIEVQYFDSSFRPVVRAIHPGRYGASVRVNTTTGKTFQFNSTLFKLAKPIDFSAISAKIDIDPISQALNCDTSIIEANKSEMISLFMRLMEDKLSTNAQAAIYFAGITEKKTGDKSFWRNNPRNKNLNWWFECLKSNNNKTVLYNHKVYSPEGWDQHKINKLPLIVFLHGANSVGEDFDRVRNEGLAKLMEAGKHLPCLVVAPQCPDMDVSWIPAKVKYLIDYLKTQYSIDESRIYITGLSMGGFGTWATIAAYPQLFAAAAPICGGGDPYDIIQLKNLPIWCFHGGADNVIPVKYSQNIVKALTNINANVKLTIYDGVGHDSWTQTYQNEELYKWMLKQKKQ